MGLIYRTTNLINGKMYIGKQVNEKRTDYIGSGRYFMRAVKKYGKENFSKEILISGIECKKELFEIETYYICYYGAHYSDNYYNLVTGGEGGHPWSDERRDKFKKILRIKYDDPIFRESLKGRRLGMKMSDLARKNMSLGQQGIDRPFKRKAVVQFDLEGNFIAEHISGEQACINIGRPNTCSPGITSCCSDKYPNRVTAYGFKWKYKSDIEKPASKS